MSNKLKKPALFLDRDGVVNIDYGYVGRVEDFEFCDGIFDFIKLFQDKGYYTFIVTNQSGIGRDFYTLDDFLNLTKYMLSEFKKEGIKIHKVEFCPHAPEIDCNCRKPNIGMVESILKDFEIDLTTSWMVGDKQSDIDLAKNAKISNSIAIGTKKIEGATHSFKSIKEAYNFFKKMGLK